jgi:hypothetical protein
MTQDSQTILASMGDPPKYHERVDRSFLPIALRQNRIEDIFTHFLRYLAPNAISTESMEIGSADQVGTEIVDRIMSRPDRFRINGNSVDVDLLKLWVGNELLVPNRASNRRSAPTFSIKPLHLAIGHSTAIDQSLPNYGALLCDLLMWRDADNNDTTVLKKLTAYFGTGADDLVAKLLEGVMWSGSTDPAYYESHVVPGDFVRSKAHSAMFRDTIVQLMKYSETASRRTMVNWLYSIMVFFLATYVLRLASASASFSTQISDLLSGNTSGDSWDGWDSELYAPRLDYDRKNLEHSPLLKLYPLHTSTLLLVSRIHEAFFSESLDTRDPDEYVAGVNNLKEQSALNPLLDLMVRTYPTNDSQRSRWRLSADQKALIIESTTDILSPFQVLTKHLNFEDMARQSNNVREWQFYATLARDPAFGYAIPARGEPLTYKLSDNALAAFLHCFASTRSAPNFAEFLEYLSGLGFRFDSDGIASIRGQLVEGGYLDDLSDAGEGKQLKTVLTPSED